MKAKTDQSKLPLKNTHHKKSSNIDGCSSYPVDEDIYIQAIEEQEIDPEDISIINQRIYLFEKNNPNDF